MWQVERGDGVSVGVEAGDGVGEDGAGAGVLRSWCCSRCSAMLKFVLEKKIGAKVGSRVDVGGGAGVITGVGA